MSTGEIPSNDPTGGASARISMKLKVVVIPVSDDLLR